MFTSHQGFGAGDYLKTANDQSLLIVLIEDIVGVKNLDEIVKVDHIDVFFVAPSDLATSTGRTAGRLVNAANVERYTRLGVRCIMMSFFPWIQAGAKDLMDRAAAGTNGADGPFSSL